MFSIYKFQKFLTFKISLCWYYIEFVLIVFCYLFIDYTNTIFYPLKYI